MGDIADMMYDIALEQEYNMWEEINSLSDEELKRVLSIVMKDAEYKEDSYTQTVISILNSDTLSQKQRKVLEYHYAKYRYIYNENEDES